MKPINRRIFLEQLSLGAFALGIPQWANSEMQGASLRPTASPDFNPDVEIELIAEAADHVIQGSEATRTWSYTGKLLKGRADALQAGGSYLGPTIRVKRGEKIRVHFRNELPEPTIVHWHGLTVPELMDGHPRLAIPTGSNYVYEFEVNNRAAQYWYHPHPHQRAGAQVNQGLSGLFIVEDDEELSLRLPATDYEIPIVLQDRTFDADSQFQYLGNHMEMMTGFLGRQILVNGSANPELTLGTATYRLRLFNGSNSRIYKLAWSDRTPMTMIGTDGGLLDAPQHKPYIMLSPAERADVILDLSKNSLGTVLELRSLAFSGLSTGMGGMMGMSGGMGRGMGGQQRSDSIAPGTEYPVLRIHVGRKDSYSYQTPARLSQPRFEREQDAVNFANPRAFAISHGPMQWTLNGAIFQMSDVVGNENVQADSLEIWEFANTDRSMMRMPHPMHIHSGQFQVLRRISDSRTQADWRTVNEGFSDSGWKDTVLVMPGERVRLLMRFPSHKGLYLYHCHILEHEDLGLMRNFRIA